MKRRRGSSSPGGLGSEPDGDTAEDALADAALSIASAPTRGGEHLDGPSASAWTPSLAPGVLAAMSVPDEADLRGEMPAFKRPHEVACFSFDEHRHLHLDARSLVRGTLQRALREPNQRRA